MPHLSLPKAAGFGNSAEQWRWEHSLDGWTGRGGVGETGCRHSVGTGLPASHRTLLQILHSLHGPFQLYKSGVYFLRLRVNKKTRKLLC